MKVMDSPNLTTPRKWLSSKRKPNKTTVSNFHSCTALHSTQAVEHLVPRPIEACQYNRTLIKATRKDGRYTKNWCNYTGKVAIVVELFSKTRICNLSV